MTGSHEVRGSIPLGSTNSTNVSDHNLCQAFRNETKYLDFVIGNPGARADVLSGQANSVAFHLSYEL